MSTNPDKSRLRNWTPPKQNGTDKQMCDEFTERLEHFVEKNSSPTHGDDIITCMDYLRKAEHVSSKIVKQLKIRAIRSRKKRQQKDGWSPQYSAYSAHLVALVEIRRNLMGHKYRKK